MLRSLPFEVSFANRTSAPQLLRRRNSLLERVRSRFRFPDGSAADDQTEPRIGTATE